MKPKMGVWIGLAWTLSLVSLACMLGHERSMRMATYASSSVELSMMELNGEHAAELIERTLQAESGDGWAALNLPPVMDSARSAFAWDCVFALSYGALFVLLALRFRRNLAGTTRRYDLWQWGWIGLAVASDWIENVLVWLRVGELGAAGGSLESSGLITGLGLFKTVGFVMAAILVVRRGLAEDGVALPLGQFTRRMWQMRFPVAVLVAVSVLPLALRASPLVANLLVLESFWAASLVGVCAGLAAATAASNCAMIRRLAVWRFDGREPDAVALPQRPRQRYFTAFGVASILTVPVYVANSVAEAAGVLIGGAVGVGALWAVHTLAWRREERLAAASTERPMDVLGKLRVAFPSPTLFRGYVDKRLAPAHRAASIGFLALVAAFVAVGVSFDPDQPTIDGIPVLAELLFLAALASSVLAGLSFFFDFLLIPVTGVVLIGTVVVGSLTKSTHEFEVLARPTALGEASAPPSGPGGETVAVPAAKPSDAPVIIVCAAGGGIQAAGWTARVLTKLGGDPGTDAGALVPEFRERLGLISAVSGGSVGAMMYVEALARRRLGTDAVPTADEVVNAAMHKGLPASGWAMCFKDVLRPMGIASSIDRGVALERVWRRALPGPSLDSTLGDWIADSDLPAVALNATLAGVGSRTGKGSRLVFSTFDFGQSDFADVYPRHDVPVVTAARMSSTFPYVTPLARAKSVVADGSPSRETIPDHYVADGGYFDNFGFVTALEWLKKHDVAGMKVAILMIDGFPEPPEVQSPSKEQGWANAVLGPLDLLIATWSSTQRDRLEAELNLLRRLQERDQAHFEFEIFRFRPRRGLRAPPLSWLLTEVEQDAVRQGFKDPTVEAEVDRLKKTLAGWAAR